MREGKKIMIDLDVVTVAEWDSDKDAINFTERVKAGEFQMHVPYTLLELLDNWEYKELASKIEHFYMLYSKTIISAQDSLDKLKEIGVDRKELVDELLAKNVKEEDAMLVIITSIFGIDYLITYNRKHLKDKEEEINEVLNKNGLGAIKVRMPNEV